MTVAVLIVAAGAGKRFGGEKPKQYQDLAGLPVLSHTLRAFLALDAVGLIQPVIAEGYEAEFIEASEAAGVDTRVLTPVCGGATRQASVRAGLEALSDHGPDLVLIHDGARPFPAATMVSEMIHTLDQGAEGAFAGVPVSDTLRRISAGGYSEGTVSREGLWRAQTPQGFHFAAILAAHREAAQDDFTDDVALAEAGGISVQVVRDTASNFKITNPEDLAMAEAMLADEKAGPVMETRIGYGYDVHRYEEGRAMILCGVTFDESPVGLKGHSDADVALHALTDALLGAVGEGDIGTHFPPSDEKWKGAPSSVFVKNAADRLVAKGGQLVNADVTLICEAPRIGPRREEMRASVADLLGTSVSRVNIKATTTEGLGFTGRREGIAAEAVVSVALPSSD